MANIAQTQLTINSSNATSTTYATASVTLPANSLILFYVSTRLPNGAADPTISGATGFSWVRIFKGNNVFGSNPLYIYRSMNTSSATGALTITMPSSQTFAQWAINSYSNVNTSGTSGAGAVGTTSGTLVLSAQTTLDQGMTYKGSINAVASAIAVSVASGSVTGRGGLGSITNNLNATASALLGTGFTNSPLALPGFAFPSSNNVWSGTVEIVNAANPDFFPFM